MAGRSGSARRRLALGGVATCIVAALAWAQPPASAQPRREGMRVEAGFDGRFVPGSRIPLRVTITATRLIEGTLEVRYPSDGHPVIQMPVEVPGGSVKEYVMVAPTGMDGTHPSAVVLKDQGRSVRERVPELAPLGDQEIVALSPGLLAGGPLPGAAPLLAETGLARFVELDEALLGQAPASLESVTVIALGPAELDQLGDRARRALLGWVQSGGVLYVDAEAGPIPGLPEEWQPSGERTTAGFGRIHLTNGRMSAGQWAGLVEPTVRAARTAMGAEGQNFEFGGGFGFQQGFFQMSLAESVAVDAGLRAPRLRGLYVFMLLYIVIVGPITFVLLRRRRRAELAWVAVPLVAVLFTVASYAGGGALRRERLAHASVLMTSAAGTTATTVAGTSGAGGITEIAFPQDWAPTTVRDRIRRAPTWQLGSEGPEARLELAPGEFSTAAASGPADAGQGLVVTGHSREDRIQGSVRNSTPFALTEVVVFVGKNWQAVGDLTPGEQRDFDVDAAPTADHWVLPGQQAWRPGQQGEPWQRPGRIEQGPVSYALWQATTSLPWGDPLSTGAVLAAGWTRDFSPPARVGGRNSTVQGRTLVLGRAPLGHESGPLDALDVVREEVRGVQLLGPEPGWDEVDPTSGPLVMRFRLPRSPESPLVLTTTADVESMDVWLDGSWQAVDPLAGGGDQPPRGLRILPGPGQGQGQRFEFEGPPGPGQPFDFQVPPAPGDGFVVPDPDAPAVQLREIPLPGSHGRDVYVRVSQPATGGPSHAGWAFDLKEQR